jgi:hypothetical protein
VRLECESLEGRTLPSANPLNNGVALDAQAAQVSDASSTDPVVLWLARESANGKGNGAAEAAAHSHGNGNGNGNENGNGNGNGNQQAASDSNQAATPVPVEVSGKESKPTPANETGESGETVRTNTTPSRKVVPETGNVTPENSAVETAAAPSPRSEPPPAFPSPHLRDATEIPGFAADGGTESKTDSALVPESEATFSRNGPGQSSEGASGVQASSRNLNPWFSYTVATEEDSLAVLTGDLLAEGSPVLGTTEPGGSYQTPQRGEVVSLQPLTATTVEVVPTVQTGGLEREPGTPTPEPPAIAPLPGVPRRGTTEAPVQRFLLGVDEVQAPAIRPDGTAEQAPEKEESQSSAEIALLPGATLGLVGKWRRQKQAESRRRGDCSPPADSVR